MSRRWGLAVALATSIALTGCGTPGSPGSARRCRAAARARPARPTRSASSTPSPDRWPPTASSTARGSRPARLRDQGHRRVAGHTIEVTEQDDAGDPAKAVASAPTSSARATRSSPARRSSGVALQVAPLAKDNKVLFISGPAAADAVTGANQLHLPLGPPDLPGRRDGRDHARRRQGQEGHRLRAGQRLRQGQRGRRHGGPRRQGRDGRARSLVPVGRHRPDAVRHHRSRASTPDLLFVAWAGANATPMWTTLGQQGVFDSTKVVTGLDIKPTHALFGEAGDEDRLPLALLRRRGRQPGVPGAGRRPQEAGRQASTCSPTTASSPARWWSARSARAAATSTRWSPRSRAGSSTGPRAPWRSAPRTTPCCSRCSRRSWSRTARGFVPQLVDDARARGRRAAGHAVQVIGRRPT